MVRFAIDEHAQSEQQQDQTDRVRQEKQLAYEMPRWLRSNPSQDVHTNLRDALQSKIDTGKVLSPARNLHSTNRRAGSDQMLDQLRIGYTEKHTSGDEEGQAVADTLQNRSDASVSIIEYITHEIRIKAEEQRADKREDNRGRFDFGNVAAGVLNRHGSDEHEIRNGEMFRSKVFEIFTIPSGSHAVDFFLQHLGFADMSHLDLHGFVGIARREHRRAHVRKMFHLWELRP